MGDASILLIGSLPVEKRKQTRNYEQRGGQKSRQGCREPMAYPFNRTQTVINGFLKITFSTTIQGNIAPRMQRIPKFNGAQSNQP